MKLLLATFVATICYVNAGKTARLLAALNGGLLPGVNGGLVPGVNGGLVPGVNVGLVPGVNGGLVPGVNRGLLPGVNGGMLAGMNGGLVNGAIPGMMAGGLNRPMVPAGGAGFFGQPQFAQFVPGYPAFAVPAPVPNVYGVPGVNALPFIGIPQMAPVNPPQQPLVGNAGAPMPQQQPAVQADPLRRFRRQTIKQDNTLKTTMDTQIPAPTETMAATACGEEGQNENY